MINHGIKESASAENDGAGDPGPMATVPVNPKPFLNDLTGKLVAFSD